MVALRDTAYNREFSFSFNKVQMRLAALTNNTQETRFGCA